MLHLWNATHAITRRLEQVIFESGLQNSMAQVIFTTTWQALDKSLDKKGLQTSTP